MDRRASARRVRGPGALVPASRRSTGSPPRACGRGIPRRQARPPGAPRHHWLPAAARRCCCGFECSAGPRRGCEGRRAGRQPRTRRRKRTRRRLPRRERRAGRRQRGWRSSAGRRARSSRRGAQARRWARAPGLQQDPARQCPARFPSPLLQSQWSGWETRGWGSLESQAHLCLGNARCCL